VRRDPSLAPLLDEAVAHVLWIKQRLGLFDDPYRFGDPERERRIMVSPEHRSLARQAAHKAIVLLKNEGSLLPLRDAVRRIAVVGALADDPMSALGSWRAQGKPEDVVTLLQSLRASLGEARVAFAPGASPESDDPSGIRAAVRAAQRAEVVILVVGESFNQSGEARSRADIGLPGAQEALARAVIATGKPVVLVLMNGRPLALNEELLRIPAILETWLLGVESGPAIVDVLFGAVSPAGRLPIALPRPGHTPEPYAHLPTGRPADPDLSKDSARYHDSPIGPLFPFGHGLSYSAFAYSNLELDRAEIGPHEEIEIAVAVTNTGAAEADEVVQLYLRDPLASVARPVKELRGFARIALKPGEGKRVAFRIAAAQMAFYDDQRRWRIEAGRIDVTVGASSEDIRARGAFSITEDGVGSAPAALLTSVNVSPA
jgi:beta-glucosidase